MKEKKIEKTVVVVLAPGFEETEAIGTADVLKRLGFTICLAGLIAPVVESSAKTRVQADLLFKDVNWGEVDALVLPGGLPGATNLRDSRAVIDALQLMHRSGKVVAAICAAPIVLERAGLAKGRKITGYPGSEKGLSDLVYTGARTECDDRIVTGRGAGVSFEFGARIAAALGTDQDKINSVLDKMFALR